MEDKLQVVRDKIRRAALKSQRDYNDIKLIAVSKTRSINEIDLAKELGIKDFGENRVQELEEKIALRPSYNWHMIGSLQSNKVKYIFDKVALIHSLDRKSLAKELEKRAIQNEIEVKALVQVNISGEDSKSGISPENVFNFFEYLEKKPHINVIGLMTMAPYTQDEKILREVFSGLRKLKLKLNEDFYNENRLKHLSMGMSNDYEIAIEEGATIVRIGSAIFGEYNY
ncbi:MAG: YggS family pyridoxal phosphate-dependent enzyme [Halanaerobiales bacterium]